jgi:UDP-N-acetylmuramoylalanine--D-glutamate ligase
MLSEEGYKCWLGGNIGMPLLDRIDEIMEEDMVVLELSSFQLHTMHNRLHTAIVTNLSPNHLDVHKSMEEYVDAKKNICRYQIPEDTVVVNYDNEITRQISNECKGKHVFFSRLYDIKGVVAKDNSIIINLGGEPVNVIDEDQILIPGKHNVENYLAAIAAVYEMVSLDSIRKVAQTFAGVEHRIELVRELNGVKYYNDSIASSPTRTIAGLNSFRQKVILIAGGYDKKIPYDVMGSIIIDKVKVIILLGKTGPKIKEAYLHECKKRGIESEIPIFEVNSLEEAVKTAKNESANGDIVTLSPASASFDMFKNFEDRGNKFKEIVKGLE